MLTIRIAFHFNGEKHVMYHARQIWRYAHRPCYTKKEEELAVQLQRDNDFFSLYDTY